MAWMHGAGGLGSLLRRPYLEVAWPALLRHRCEPQVPAGLTVYPASQDAVSSLLPLPPPLPTHIHVAARQAWGGRVF